MRDLTIDVEIRETWRLRLATWLMYAAIRLNLWSKRLVHAEMRKCAREVRGEARRDNERAARQFKPAIGAI